MSFLRFIQSFLCHYGMRRILCVMYLHSKINFFCIKFDVWTFKCFRWSSRKVLWTSSLMRWNRFYANKGCLFVWIKVSSLPLFYSPCIRKINANRSMLFCVLQVLWSLFQTLLFVKRESLCHLNLLAYWFVPWFYWLIHYLFHVVCKVVHLAENEFLFEIVITSFCFFSFFVLFWIKQQIIIGFYWILSTGISFLAAFRLCSQPIDMHAQ